MWNPFKRSEKPIEQTVKVRKKEPNYLKTIFEHNELLEYSVEEKKVLYQECATILTMSAFMVTANNLIRKYGFDIIRELDNTPIRTTKAELERQKILAIEDFVEQVEIAASRLKDADDKEREEAKGVQNYGQNNLTI